MSFILIEFTLKQLEITREMSTTKGFCKLFNEHLSHTKTVIRAYEMTEEVHEDLFGKRKFSSYNSFYNHGIKKCML